MIALQRSVLSHNNKHLTLDINGRQLRGDHCWSAKPAHMEEVPGSSVAPHRLVPPSIMVTCSGRQVQSPDYLSFIHEVHSSAHWKDAKQCINVLYIVVSLFYIFPQASVQPQSVCIGTCMIILMSRLNANADHFQYYIELHMIIAILLDYLR